MPQLTVIDGGGSPAERAKAEVSRDQYDFGPPPRLTAGISHASIGALCGLISLTLFFAVAESPNSSPVGDHWPVFMVAGALIGWFVRFDPNGDP